jgi:hypothetical protein
MTAITITALAMAESGAGSLVQYGVAGICLLALAGYYVLKDLRYEARINEMREMEKAFRKEQAEQQMKFREEQAQVVEKYRQAMEKVTQSLDIVISLMKGQGK